MYKRQQYECQYGMVERPIQKNTRSDEAKYESCTHRFVRVADAVDYFARYVRYVMSILHDVTWVCTINEPNMVALTRGGTEGSDFVAASLPLSLIHIYLRRVRAGWSAVGETGIPGVTAVSYTHLIWQHCRRIAYAAGVVRERKPKYGRIRAALLHQKT